MQRIDLSEDSYILTGSIPDNVAPSLPNLMSQCPPAPDTVIMMGKPVLTPRFVAHYLKPYYYTGRTHPAKDLPDNLKPLLDWCNTVVLHDWLQQEGDEKNNIETPKFNQGLVNYYMNGIHYIGKHSDDERQLIKNSPIFSASFGQERTFRIRNKKDGSIVEDITMRDKSFIVMCGKLQNEFTHEVPKVVGVKGANMSPRVNVTFRIFKK